ncbi:MAG TPA: ARMT1-like domain-containing protein, partial [Mycobacteriales bacterium]
EGGPGGAVEAAAGGAGGAARAAARRLHAAAGDGRLAVRAHWFSAAPYELRLMPADLAGELASASLVLVKGDLNYRRLVGDRRWDPTTPLAAILDYLPTPVLALRTLKSDVVVGLDPGTVAALEASGGAWRTDGTHALVQLRP